MATITEVGGRGMTREEYENEVREKIFDIKNEFDNKLLELHKELMAEYKEEEPSIDGWKVGDKYYVRFDGREIRIETIGCDDKGKIYDYDIYNVTHGYAKRTAEEVQFQIERDAVLYELSKYAEPKDAVWDGRTNHFYICYIATRNEMTIDYMWKTKSNNIYFASREDAEKAIQAVGEERVKRYYLGVEE